MSVMGHALDGTESDAIQKRTVSVVIVYHRLYVCTKFKGPVSIPSLTYFCVLRPFSKFKATTMIFPHKFCTLRNDL